LPQQAARVLRHDHIGQFARGIDEGDGLRKPFDAGLACALAVFVGEYAKPKWQIRRAGGNCLAKRLAGFVRTVEFG